MAIEVFKPSVRLSSKYAIKSAGSHFYTIGLSHYKFGDSNRSRFNNPYFIFINLLVIIIKNVLSLILKTKNISTSIFLGDYVFFISMRYQLYLFQIIGFLHILIIQLIHYWYYHYNIYPLYLKPFEMIAGLSSPQSIGLTQENDVIGFIKYTDRLFKISKVCALFAFPVGFSFSMYLTFKYCTYIQLILLVFM